MLPLVLGELVLNAKRVWAMPPLLWEPCEVEPGELEAAEHEANTGAQFDTLGLKEGIWNDY